MPNWCDSRFKITGTDKGMVMKFCVDMTKATGGLGGLSEEERGYKDSTGKKCVTAEDWFGNLYLAAGYTMEEIEKGGMHARGFETTVTLDEVGGSPCVCITANMAWNPPIDEMRRMIKEKYDNKLKLYYWAEEPGMEIYLSNDPTGEYFDAAYVIDYDTVDDGCDRIYFGPGRDEEEKAVRLINSLTGLKFEKIEDILAHEEEVQSAFEKKHGSGDAYLSIHDFCEY